MIIDDDNENMDNSASDDDIAAAWEAELEAGGSGLTDEDTVDLSLSDESDTAVRPSLAGPRASMGSERILSQEEIDALLGFAQMEESSASGTGVKALIDSAHAAYERLPMLEVVFERLVRLMTTSLRNLTSDNVEVSIDTMTSVRFGDYLNSIPLPAILTVFTARQLENSGLVTVNSQLIYSMIDVLLGGRNGGSIARADGRPYTRIERNMVGELVEVVLADASAAFAPVMEIDFVLDRVESNPRFAAVSQSGDAAILVRLRVDMDDRGGRLDVVMPYVTLEPIRELLLQNFMGEKFGRDEIWENHLARQLLSSQTQLQVVMDEFMAPLGKLMTMEAGDTLMMSVAPETRAILKCGDICLTGGRVGRVGQKVALRVDRPVRASAHGKMIEAASHAL